MINAIYVKNINKIGGIESVIYNVVRKYKDIDITIVYQTGDSDQLYRLSRYAHLYKWDCHSTIKCERLFINYGYEDLVGHIDCDDVYYVVHANYKEAKAKPCTNPNFHYLGVSEYVCEIYEEITGIKPKLFPNPIYLEDYPKAITIVSATRLYVDKGNITERMETLASRLEQRQIPFVWLVFTNDNKYKFKSKNIIKLEPRLDIIPYLKSADFVAQLSTSEGSSMTTMESATLSKPMLLTKIPSFYEQGINDDMAIYFDFDMSNVDTCIDRMFEKFDYKFTPKQDKWGEYLLNRKRSNVIPMKRFKVRATENVQYAGGVSISEFGGKPNPNDEAIVLEDRLETLATKNNISGKPLVEVICEVVEETPKETPVVEKKKTTKKAK